MVSQLPYKSARTFEDALAELRRCSGTQFDPKVIMAFLDWFQIYGEPREQQVDGVLDEINKGSPGDFVRELDLK
jgi:HD-GYP domain-containing protein (c-di-GMP phosphodiesterase class II)